LLFKTNDEKFSLGRVKSKKICRHPGGDVFQSSLEVGEYRLLTAQQHNYPIQCHSRWFTLETTGQKTN